jgi:hypothetical protein
MVTIALPRSDVDRGAGCLGVVGVRLRRVRLTRLGDG